MFDLMQCSVETDEAQHWLSIIEESENEEFVKGCSMENVDELKAKIKKLNQQATALKMDLHDLSEDLPTGWEKIMEVAQKTHSAYESLDAAKKQLAGMAS